MKLVGATDSHVGNVREANQDRVFFGGVVAALADGMGGHQGGERAAELAIAEFEHANKKLTESELVEMIMEANRQVHDHAADNGLPGMGTTLVALTLHGDETITVANVGDSRAYWLRGDYMGQVTEDHSFVEDLVRQGRLSPEDAAVHPQRNILTRAVGIGAQVEVDRFPIPEPEVGDRFLLCSDGLFNELSEEEILGILLDAGGPESTAKALVGAALQTPCRDNVTVAVVDVVADDDPSVTGNADEDQTVEDVLDDDDDEQDSQARTTKPITAPVPVVSKSTLHEPGASNGQSEESGRASGGTGTLVLDGPDPEPDPEQFLDTTELDIVEIPSAQPPAVKSRGPALVALGLAIVLALVAGGLYWARSYARSGFHIVVEEDQGQLVVFEGRPGGFLFFSPDSLNEMAPIAGDLNEDQAERVNQHHAKRDDVIAEMNAISKEQMAGSGASSSTETEADQPGSPATLPPTPQTDQGQPEGTSPPPES